jgi:PEGA domain
VLRALTALVLAVLGPATGDEAVCDPPEPGFLTLETRPWTVVYVDGVYAGSTPLFREKLAPGAHTLTLVNEAAGVLTHEDIVVDAGRTRRLKLLLQADATDTALDASADARASAEDCIVPDDEMAWLSVDTKPWSRVFVDGKRVGSTPLFELPLARGEHVVRLEREDGTRAFARFSALAGETVRLSIALGPRPP